VSTASKEGMSTAGLPALRESKPALTLGSVGGEVGADFCHLGVIFTCGGRWLEWLADGRRGKCNTDGRNRVMIY